MSLLRHETIRTTIPKAKELRRVVEPLITLGKEDSEANRRLAFSRLRDSEIVAKLFDTIGPRFKARPGGYTRILHMAPRPGDNAPMALMQLVERSAPVAVEAEPEDKKAKKAESPKVDKAEKKAKAEAKKGREKAAKGSESCQGRREEGRQENGRCGQEEKGRCSEEEESLRSSSKRGQIYFFPATGAERRLFRFRHSQSLRVATLPFLRGRPRFATARASRICVRQAR